MWVYLNKNEGSFDIIYIPSNQYPFFLKGGIFTIHDLIYEQFPQQLGRFAKIKKIYLHWIVKHGLKHSKYIIAVSNYTKKEILNWHKLENIDNKISLVYEGWEHLENLTFLDKNKFEKPFENYFLYIGSSRGHKNLTRLLKAFYMIKDELNWGLVIVGNMSRLLSKDLKLIEKINIRKQNITFTGQLDDSILKDYYSNASAFVFPSLCEGFGIPILESFYFGIPLICSNNSVFPEIAGEAAIYFDPYSIQSIAASMKEFAQKKELLSPEMIALGKIILPYFTWKKAASEIHELIATY
jgi:glycosyltransferase involved in cell wall biosynthesis